MRAQRKGAGGAVERAVAPHAQVELIGGSGPTQVAPVDHPAFETLRRDRHARALLDLPGTSWMTLLRSLLGAPDPALAHTNAGRGVLLRLLIGEPLRALLLDDELVLAVSLAAPRRYRGGEQG